MEFDVDHSVVYVAADFPANYHTPKKDVPDEAFMAGDIIIGGSEGTPWAKPAVSIKAVEAPYNGEVTG